MTTTNKDTAPVLTTRGVHFSDKKEEAYFGATFTLPRVGEVTASFTADRYVHWSEKGDKWGDWRITCRDDIPGVGPKTRSLVYSTVEPVIEAWLAGEGYKAARQVAVANFIIRELTNSRWGLSAGKRSFEAYRHELGFFDQTRIAQAIDHLEAAEKLLSEKSTAELEAGE